MRQAVRGAAFAIVLTGCVLTFVCDALAQPGPSPDWPRFLGSSIDGVAPESSLDVDWSQAPEVLWTKNVGEGYGIGSVADGKYFHFDAVETSEKTGGGSLRTSNERVERLRCIDMKSGDVVWTASSPLEFRDLYGYETGPRSSPTISTFARDDPGSPNASGQVFTLGVRGDLVCRSIADGKPQWAVATSDAFSVVQNFFGVGSAPLVTDDLVIVMVGGSPREDQQIAPGRLDRVSPNGTGLVAFERESGKVRWKSVDDLASYSSPRPITLDGKRCVLLFARDHLWCVEESTGDTMWKFRHRDRVLESVNAMTPVVRGAEVFISECYGVGSVLLKATNESVDVVWKDDPRRRREMSMRSHWATPVLHDGRLYGCSGRNAPDSDFRCVDWSTGEVLWSDLPRRRSSVTLVDSHLLVLEERGTLHVTKADPTAWNSVSKWDFASGEIVQSDGDPVRLKYPCWSAPVVVGDRVLIRGDKTVVCLRWATR